MAKSALEAGYEVVVYARWEPGVPLESEGPGYRIVRVPVVPALALPGLRGRGRRELARVLQRATANETALSPVPVVAKPAQARRPLVDGVPKSLRGTWFGRPLRHVKGVIGRARRRLMIYPIRPIAWAVALDAVVEPADLWHGMWATSLPALDRLRRSHGGRTVYDSRDIYMHARSMEGLGRTWRWLLGGLERRWARRCDAILTVNDAYAEILARRFEVPRPPVVRNTPARYSQLTPRPDLLRQRLDLAATTRIVLYQGGLMTERGIEQGMEAILSVPDAMFVLMGFGSQEDTMMRLGRSDRYRDRVRFVDPAPPADLLDWTASADVMLMAIQPTTLNHRYTTPQKLWEAIAAGVPVVASDLPGMAAVVHETGCGELVDPTDPADVARGILAILDLPAPDRRALEARCRAGGEVYCWEHEVDVLLDLYERLVGPAGPRVLPFAPS